MLACSRTAKYPIIGELGFDGLAGVGKSLREAMFLDEAIGEGERRGLMVKVIFVLLGTEGVAREWE